MPADLDPAAAKIWTETLEAISLTRHIGQGHAAAFRQFCETAATCNAMQPKGSKEWREIVSLNLKLARELCLTPATSGHLVAKYTEERKLARFAG